MKNDNLFSELMGLLAVNNGKALDPAQIVLFRQAMEPYDDKTCKLAVNEAMQKSAYPIIRSGQLHEYLERDDEAEQAWESVWHEVQTWYIGKPLYLHNKNLQSIIESVGGWSRLRSIGMNEVQWVKRNFIKEYGKRKRQSALPQGEVPAEVLKLTENIGGVL